MTITIAWWIPCMIIAISIFVAMCVCLSLFGDIQWPPMTCEFAIVVMAISLVGIVVCGVGPNGRKSTFHFTTKQEVREEMRMQYISILKEEEAKSQNGNEHQL